MQESARSAVGDKYPPGCNPSGDRANKNYDLEYI